MRGARSTPDSARSSPAGRPAGRIRWRVRALFFPLLSVIALTAATDALIVPTVFQVLNRSGARLPALAFLDRGDLEAILAALILACVLGLAFTVWNLRLNQLRL